MKNTDWIRVLTICLMVVVPQTAFCDTDAALEEIGIIFVLVPLTGVVLIALVLGLVLAAASKVPFLGAGICTFGSILGLAALVGIPVTKVISPLARNLIAAGLFTVILLAIYVGWRRASRIAGLSPAEIVRAELQSLDPDHALDAYLKVFRQVAKVENKGQREALISQFFLVRLRLWLRCGMYGNAKGLLKTYAALTPVIGSPVGSAPVDQPGGPSSLAEAIANEAVFLMAMTRDDTLWPLVESLLPRQITWAPMAYNLASYCAETGRKDLMIEFARCAISLGTQHAQFLADSNFERYRVDPDFLEIFQRPEKAEGNS